MYADMDFFSQVLHCLVFLLFLLCLPFCFEVPNSAGRVAVVFSEDLAKTLSEDLAKVMPPNGVQETQLGTFLLFFSFCDLSEDGQHLLTFSVVKSRASKDALQGSELTCVGECPCQSSQRCATALHLW